MYQLWLVFLAFAVLYSFPRFFFTMQFIPCLFQPVLSISLHAFRCKVSSLFYKLFYTFLHNIPSQYHLCIWCTYIALFKCYAIKTMPLAAVTRTRQGRCLPACAIHISKESSIFFPGMVFHKIPVYTEIPIVAAVTHAQLQVNFILCYKIFPHYVYIIL